MVLRSGLGRVVRGLFPPVQVALACELPAEKDVALSRWSSAEAREAVARGIVERISGVRVWRWLSADAIRPWKFTRENLDRHARSRSQRKHASPGSDEKVTFRQSRPSFVTLLLLYVRKAALEFATK